MDVSLLLNLKKIRIMGQEKTGKKKRAKVVNGNFPNYRKTCLHG